MSEANRFRFRAWLPNGWEWCGKEHPEPLMLYFDLPKPGEASIITQSPIRGESITMQSVGLLDKNGKEIFEGDIIKSLIDDTLYIWEVSWENINDICGWSITYMHARLGEIIGNVYENKNLLKE